MLTAISPMHSYASISPKAKTANIQQPVAQTPDSFQQHEQLQVMFGGIPKRARGPLAAFAALVLAGGLGLGLRNNHDKPDNNTGTVSSAPATPNQGLGSVPKGADEPDPTSSSSGPGSTTATGQSSTAPGANNENPAPSPTTKVSSNEIKIGNETFKLNTTFTPNDMAGWLGSGWSTVDQNNRERFLKKDKDALTLFVPKDLEDKLGSSPQDVIGLKSDSFKIPTDKPSVIVLDTNLINAQGNGILTSFGIETEQAKVAVIPMEAAKICNESGSNCPYTTQSNSSVSNYQSQHPYKTVGSRYMVKMNPKTGQFDFYVDDKYDHSYKLTGEEKATFFSGGNLYFTLKLRTNVFEPGLDKDSLKKASWPINGIKTYD